MAGAERGLGALTSFAPSAEAFAPSVEMVALQRAAMANAVRAGQLGPEADSDEAIWSCRP